MRLLKNLCAHLLFGLLIGLTLAPASHVYAALITLSASSGPPGTVVSITGTGFPHGNYTVMFGPVQVISSANATDTGTISSVFSVPVLPRTGNPYNVTVISFSGEHTDSFFTITPVIWLGNSSGNVSETVPVSGCGFLANETVTISFDGIDKIISASDGAGSFSSAEMIIPQVKAGWHTIAARDYIGTSPGIVYVVTPKISLSANSVICGSSVVCTGNGFSADSNISFSLDASAIEGVAITDGNGVLIDIAITIPRVASGMHTLRVRDSSGNYATASFDIISSIEVNPHSGPAGTHVVVTGSGFRANRSVSITYNSLNVTTDPPVVKCNDSGSFIASFMTPSLPGGIYDISVSDSAITTTAQFISNAAASVDLGKGIVGIEVKAEGSGFRPRATISIKYEGVQLLSCQSDVYGNFKTILNIPPSCSGLHEIIITDKVNVLSFPFIIEPAITSNPGNGHVGSEITINASGLSSEKLIVVKYDEEQITSGQTDKDGTFNASIKAPSSQGGDHTITVTDGVNTLKAAFTMDSLPPIQPVLNYPLNSTKARNDTTFSWQAVNDPSGLTYSMQIATDSAFSDLVMQKQWLSTAEYTLTEQDVLKPVSKNTPYYWRVKAIDGASNESEWSVTSTFYIGFVLGDWVLYVVSGGITVLCGVCGFLLGKRFRIKTKNIQ